MAQTAVDVVLKVVGAQKLKQLDNSLKGTAANAVKAGTGLNTTAVGAKKAGNAARNASSGFDRLNKSLGAIALVATAVGAAVNTFNASIARTESERKIKILGEAYGEAGALAQVATDSATKFGKSQTEVNNALAKTYARLRPVGVGLEDIASTYNGFQTAARLSGASAQESSAAFTQLAQALGAGRLAGDEFRSIAEQAPLVLQAISKETGIAVGQLKQFAADGNLTADIVIKALKRIETEGTDKLAETLKGPAQAFTNLKNASEDLFAGLGNLGEGVLVAAVNAITAGIKTITNSLNVLGPLVTNTFKLIYAGLQGFAQGFTEAVGPVKGFGEVVKKTIAVVAVILGDLAKIVGSVFSFIGKAVGTIARFVGQALNFLLGDVAEFGQGVVKNVSNMVRQVAQLISKLINALTGLGSVLLEKVFGINLGDVITAPLNALADGIDNVGASVAGYVQSVNSRANALVAPKIEENGTTNLDPTNLGKPDGDGTGKSGGGSGGGKGTAEKRTRNTKSAISSSQRASI